MLQLKTRFAVALAAVLVAIFPGQATAQDDNERFRLFNECEPMRLLVEDLSDDSAKIDLTRERVQTMAERRLRAARLYDADAIPYLYVNVGVSVRNSRRNGAFNVYISYRKLLLDVASGESGLAQTWIDGSYGTHGADADYILQGLSELLDVFVLEYLRANEDACER